MGLDGADEEHGWRLAGSGRGERQPPRRKQRIVCDCGSGLSQSWGESCRGAQRASTTARLEARRARVASRQQWQLGEWEAWAQTARRQIGCG